MFPTRHTGENQKITKRHVIFFFFRDLVRERLSPLAGILFQIDRHSQSRFTAPLQQHSCASDDCSVGCLYFRVGSLADFAVPQNKIKSNNAIHRTPARWQVEFLVSTLPALVAPAVRCR